MNIVELKYSMLYDLGDLGTAFIFEKMKIFIIENVQSKIKLTR